MAIEKLGRTVDSAPICEVTDKHLTGLYCLFLSVRHIMLYVVCRPVVDKKNSKMTRVKTSIWFLVWILAVHIRVNEAAYCSGKVYHINALIIRFIDKLLNEKNENLLNQNVNMLWIIS